MCNTWRRIGRLMVFKYPSLFFRCNKINQNEKEISKCKETNKQREQLESKLKSDVKSSNILLVVLYLMIILIITKLIFKSIPYIVVMLVITVFMLEMLYRNGFSAVFMYNFM